MTDRLGGDAERVSSPGEYQLHVRRLVALFAGLGVLEIGILSGPTIYLTEGVKPIVAALLLAPIVVLAVVIAGVATGTMSPVLFTAACISMTSSRLPPDFQ